MWFNQEFSFFDIPTLLFLFFLECVLSADNALVMAGIVKPLPFQLRKKALWIGVFSAFVLRAIVIAVASFLIRYLYIQMIGAIYLLYLSFALRKKSKNTFAINSQSLWKTVLYIETLDLLFAIDSILAALGIIGAASSSSIHPKLWIVYVGGIFGLVAMRFSVKIFSYLMDKFHKLEHATHYLIAWIGLKLGFESVTIAFFSAKAEKFHFYSELVFWIVALAFFLYGFLPAKKNKV